VKPKSAAQATALSRTTLGAQEATATSPKEKEKARAAAATPPQHARTAGTPSGSSPGSRAKTPAELARTKTPQAS